MIKNESKIIISELAHSAQVEQVLKWSLSTTMEVANSYFCNNLIIINNYGHKFSWSTHKLFREDAHRYPSKELNRMEYNLRSKLQQGVRQDRTKARA